MSTSELYLDESSSSVESECESSGDIDDYELEVEEFDVGSASASNEASGKSWEDNTVAAATAVFPYSDEPIADIEWIEEYEREKESEKLHVEALKQRLDGTIAVSQWCKCGNCDTALLQNVYECQCCQEIPRCVDNLQSEDVLQDTGTPPSCVTHHPGFRVNCLEKWSLRMSASKYRTKICRRRYRQSGSEES
ncbi:Hypothetical predicted protein [Paramuricea clavata]|uniref:Uncharacterized protein n=1 Tax=Paramuricea clavata TaxID=317549 RepID=A0A7D9J4E8_PARCT|nr:Hypothetical predicted protein [Paramuricea clavata]